MTVAVEDREHSVQRAQLAADERAARWLEARAAGNLAATREASELLDLALRELRRTERRLRATRRRLAKRTLETA